MEEQEKELCKACKRLHATLELCDRYDLLDVPVEAATERRELLRQWISYGKPRFGESDDRE